MRIENPLTGEVYEIRSVPLSEARELRAFGAVMYDYTKLTAANTCPTYGVLRYGLHKTDIPLSAGGRRMALECGKACHDFFAALRIWHLRESGSIDNAAISAHAIKLFGLDRYDSMLSVPQDSDRVNNAQLFALDALHTSGFYDDPSERKRTMANMEASCLAYADRYFKSDIPVAVKGEFIGIEIPFVLEITRYTNTNFRYSDGSIVAKGVIKARQYYCGRIDGIHRFGDKYIVAENKTASLLSQNWRTAFAISHQVTGYTIAGTEIFGEEISDAFVMGTQIPLPRDVFNGVAFEHVPRTHNDKLRWCEWFFHSIDIYQEYINNPTYAPRYSHSCNRFFSACEFIPFCAANREDQVQALEQMREEEWNPLDHLVESSVSEGA